MRQVDTGGWEVDVEGIDASVAEQAEIAVELADAVLFVVDAMVGPTASDEEVTKMLRASGKPVLLVAHKVDDAHRGPHSLAFCADHIMHRGPTKAIVIALLDSIFGKPARAFVTINLFEYRALCL